MSERESVRARGGEMEEGEREGGREGGRDGKGERGGKREGGMDGGGERERARERVCVLARGKQKDLVL